MFLQYGPVQFTLVKINSPGIAYRSPCSYYPITSSVPQIHKWLQEVKLEGGLVEHALNLSEGLAAVMEVLKLMESTREPWYIDFRCLLCGQP